MKRIIPILSIVFVSVLALADFPIASNSSTVDVSKVTGNADSFSWIWTAGNSQTATVYVVNGTSQVDLTGYNLSWKMAQEKGTGRTNAIVSTNFTIATNYVSFGVARTNVPLPGTYTAELLGWTGSTNLVRSMFQGKITVIQSLF